MFLLTKVLKENKTDKVGIRKNDCTFTGLGTIVMTYGRFTHFYVRMLGQIKITTQSFKLLTLR
jgi:hypothetical protein